MAGIGFELRKIYGKKTLFSAITGTIYATMSTMGPTVIFIIVLVGISYVLQFNQASLRQTDFFTSSFTYNFLIGLMVTVPISNVISRYISDKIFEERDDLIGASLIGCAILVTIASALIVGVLCFFLYTIDHISIDILILYFFLCIFVANMYSLMTYISAIKEYRRVTVSFLLGFLVGAILFVILYYILQIGIVFSLYAGILLAIFLINIFLLSACLKAFRIPNKNIFDFLPYFKKYPQLAITGFCYMGGVFVTNILYWNMSDMQMAVGILKTAPTYDLAIFLALIINFPALIIFVVKTETQFFEKNIAYLSAINRGSYHVIEKTKESMINTLKLQLFFVYDVQLIITIFLICSVGVLFPYLGLSTKVVNMFMVLGMGIYCVLCMYFTIVILFYFDDYNSTAIIASIFFVVEIIASLICVKLEAPYYTLPVLIAGIISWSISYLFLRNRLRHINRYLLCK